MVKVSVLFPRYPEKDSRDDRCLEGAAVARVLEGKNAGKYAPIIKNANYRYFTFGGALDSIPLLVQDKLISPSEGSRLETILKDFDVESADFKGLATSPVRCASVMAYLATPSSQLSSNIHQQVGEIPPAFIGEFREALTRLCGRYAKFADRLELNKEKQLVDFLKTFTDVAQNILHKRCRFVREVSGLVDVKGYEFAGNRKLGLALARSGVIDSLVKLLPPNVMIRKSKPPKYIPRKIATVWGGVLPDQIAVYIQCGVLVGDDFAIEYETEEKACLYSAGSKTGIDEEFVKRLLWLIPFDMATIALGQRDTSQDPEDYGDEDMWEGPIYTSDLD